jgi:hypothetical protein
MKRLLAAMTAALLMVALVSSTALANDKHGNVGTAYGISGVIYDASGTLVDYTCASVHRTVVPGGWQDKENCTLAAGSVLPLKATTVTQTLRNFLSAFPYYCSYDGTLWAPTVTYHDYSGAFYNTTIWYSDYTYTTLGTFETAANWSYKLGTNGSVSVTAFFPKIAIPDPCF